MALNSRGCIIRQSEVDVVPAVRPRTSSSREPVKAISPLKTKASHMCGRRFFCAWHLQANAMPATIGIPIPTRREEEQASSITIATCWKYDLQGCRAERLKLWGVPATHIRCTKWPNHWPWMQVNYVTETVTTPERKGRSAVGWLALSQAEFLELHGFNGKAARCTRPCSTSQFQVQCLH